MTCVRSSRSDVVALVAGGQRDPPQSRPGTAPSRRNWTHSLTFRNRHILPIRGHHVKALRRFWSVLASRGWASRSPP